MPESLLTISILAASLLTFPKLPQLQKICLSHHPNNLPLMPPSWERTPPKTPPQVPLLLGALGHLCPLLSFGQSRHPALGARQASKPKEEWGGIVLLWPQQHPSPASNPWGAQALWGGWPAALQIYNLRPNSAGDLRLFTLKKQPEFLCSKRI